MTYTIYYDTPGTLLTYAEYQSIIAVLAASNGWTYQTFGQSERNVNIDGVIINPTAYIYTIFVQCGIHGYERWPIRAAVDLLNYFNEHPEQINNQIRYIVLPCLNPDGYEADTRPNNNNLTDDLVDPWPRSVDLNRNFSTGWGNEGSSDPSNPFYTGPFALSESESTTCANIFSTYDIDLFVDTHTTLDYLTATCGYYVYHFSAVSDNLVANGFSDLSSYSVDSSLGGSAKDYGASEGKAESFTLELDEDGSTIHEEVNRFICIVTTLADSAINSSNAHNTFLKDQSCKAHYRFNSMSGAAIDELCRTPLLPQNGPIQDTLNFFSGDASYDLGSSAYYRVYDGSLPSDFPLKSGTDNKEFGYAVRFMANALPANGNNRAIVSKYQSSGNARSFLLTLVNDSGVYKLRMLIGYNNGTAAEDMYVLTLPTLTTGEWYLVAGGIKDSDKSYYHEFWDETERLAYGGGNYNNNINLSSAQLELGSDIGVGSTYHFDCNLDEVVFFDTIPTTEKISEIWGDSFGSVEYVSFITYPLDDSTDISQPINFSWSAVPDAIGYQLQIADTEANLDINPVVDTTTTAPTTTKEVSGLDPSTTYYARVRAQTP